MQTAVWFEPNSEAASLLGHRTQNPCNAVAIKDLKLTENKNGFVLLKKRKREKKMGHKYQFPGQLRMGEKVRGSQRVPPGTIRGI